MDIQRLLRIFIQTILHWEIQSLDKA